MSPKPDWWTSDEWATPPEIVASLEAELGHFDLDPCCRPETARAPRFFTKDVDGLTQPWIGRVFLNPPYSKPAPWIKKAIEEISAGRCVLVAAVLPVRTDTGWFHDLIKDRAEIRFIRRRVLWLGWEGTPIDRPKDPTMIAIFRPQIGLQLATSLPGDSRK